MARSIKLGCVAALAALVGSVGCGSDDSESEDPGGIGGSRASGGASAANGGTIHLGGTTATGGATSTGGATATGGSTGTGGSKSTGGSSGTGGATGTQPLGSICANDGNCSQTEGETMCCMSSCTLSEQCPSSPLYLPCNAASDCAAFGGGKVCCELASGGQTMRFCTKPSACSGGVLP
jgi:hypothetical protein